MALIKPLPFDVLGEYVQPEDLYPLIDAINDGIAIVSTPPHMDQIQDVEASTPEDGDVLAWNTGNAAWTNSASLGLSTVQTALGDGGTESVILDHVVERSTDPATNRVNVQNLLDALKPTGTRKRTRLFIPPQFDEGEPDPLVFDRSGSAWALDVPSGVIIEGAGHGSTLKLADGQVNFARLITIDGVERVTVRNLRLDGNVAGQNPSNVQSHNINVTDSSDVLIEDVESVNAAGDGLYIGALNTTDGSHRVLVRHLVSSGCGRNPLSVCDASDVWIVDPDLDCSSGGQAIDSEPIKDAIHSGLHILGGKIKNSGGGAYALALDGKDSTYPRRRTSVIGVEFDGGGIHFPFVEDCLIQGTFGAVGDIYSNRHSRRVSLLHNDWISSSTGIGVQGTGITGGTEYPAYWTVLGNRLVCESATIGWELWDMDDLVFGGNATYGTNGTTDGISIRPAFRTIKNILIQPNIWQSLKNGIYVQPDGAVAKQVNGLSIAEQIFNDLSARAIDLQTTDYITALAIAAQSRTSVGNTLRVGNGTPYIMAGVQGAGAIWNCYGTPEGAITAAVGAMALRRDGGANTTLYIKESGTGNTGWSAK